MLLSKGEEREKEVRVWGREMLIFSVLFIHGKFCCRTVELTKTHHQWQNMPSTITKPCVFAITHCDDYLIHFSNFKREKVGKCLFYFNLWLFTDYLP